jgi:hypothetical protein
MRLKALDDALKDAFFNGVYGWMKLEGSSGSVETLPPFKGVLAHYGDSEGYETVSPKDMELIKVEGDLSADELGYIIYLRKKYKDLEPEIKQEIVRIRKEQAVEFLEEREKVIKAQGEGEKSLDYYEDYLELKKNPDIQDFLKACDILPQGLWLSEEDEFITCDGFSEDDRTDIQNRFPVLLSYYEAILKEVLLEEGKNTAPDEVPELQNLNKLTEGTSPVLRKWKGGKYKCCSLERFIKEYQKLSDYLTPALIRDYLISDRNGKPYTDSTIEQRIKEYRT